MEETYQRFDRKTKEEVLEALEKFGSEDNMEECQNDSPSVREFLELANRYPQIKYIGYLILKPRTDYRVSIEGFNVDNLTADQALELMQEFQRADEVGYNKTNSTYSLRVWYD